MPNLVIYGDEARKKLKEGVDKLARAVVTTLGPKGRNVSIHRGWGVHTIHDGVSVARSLSFKDKYQDIGAKLVTQASSRTNDVAGDGTTTATLLTQSIVHEGFQNLVAGVNAMSLRKDLESAKGIVIENLREQSEPISTKEDKRRVATISSQNEEMGELIAEALEKVGDNGIVSIEESGKDLEVEYKEGMQFDKGYLNHAFITDFSKLKCEIKDCFVMVTDKSLNTQEDIFGILEKVQPISKRIAIIAENVSGDALGILLANKVKGNIEAVAIAAPEFGDKRTNLLEDIAAVTGATLISDINGLSLKDASVEHLGRVEKITVSRDETILVGGRGEQEAIDNRVSMIKTQLSQTKSEYDKEKLQERLAKLSSGAAVISVGASTESETMERKLRVEDAVNATKAAVEEGIVEGGGMALFRAREKLDRSLLGHDIMYRALEKPLRTIVENAGLDSGEIIAEIKRTDKGFDVMSETFVDMKEAGIIDPAKVTISAVTNAVSSAIMILTTDCLVIPDEEDSK